MVNCTINLAKYITYIQVPKIKSLISAHFKTWIRMCQNLMGEINQNNLNIYQCFKIHLQLKYLPF